jgi:hypothetical protein
MKILLISLLFCVSVITQAQTWNRENEIAYKFYQDSTGFYIIKYEYDPAFCTIPLTYPAGNPHYPASITVYEVVDKDTIQVGNTFEGTYVKEGCFEDIPEDQVKKAKSTIGEPIKIWGIDSTYLQDYAIYVDTISPISDEWIIKYKPSDITVTLQDLFDYEQECYNDSTLVGYSYVWNFREDSMGSQYMGRDCYCTWSINYNNGTSKTFDANTCIYPEDFKSKMGFDYERYEPIIYHPEPTLGGFITYLRKWYKNYMK